MDKDASVDNPYAALDVDGFTEGNPSPVDSPWADLYAPRALEALNGALGDTLGVDD